MNENNNREQLEHGDETARSKTFRRKEPTINNNDPCYCGSKLKYKRCHGLKKRFAMQDHVIDFRRKAAEANKNNNK